MPKLPDVTQIRHIRRKLNISQQKLQDELNIPQATISRIENGKGNPSYITVKKIFDYLEHEKLIRKKLKRRAETIMTKNPISISSKSKIKKAVELMNEYNISQLPIIEDGKNIGSITSKKLQKTITENPELIHAEVDLIKDLPFPEIGRNWDIKDISNLLMNYPAVLVKEHNEYIGIITDADFLGTII